jgi:hypothetical protein
MSKIRVCKLCPKGLGKIEGTDHYMMHFVKHIELLDHLKGDWTELSQFCYDWFLEDDDE